MAAWATNALLISPSKTLFLLLLVRVSDSQPQPQRGFSDEFPCGVQVHGRPRRLPEAREVSGGHHLHGEHVGHQGERHLLRHLHPALR